MELNLNKHPIDIFSSWLDEAKISEVNDPDAMSFSTVSDDGYPSVRMVLLKDNLIRMGLFFLQITIVENPAKLKKIAKVPYVSIGSHLEDK